MTDHWTLCRLGQFPERDAVIDNGKVFSYADILERIHTWTRVIDEEKIRQGEIIGLDADFSADSFSLMTALVLNRNIVMPMPGLNREQTDERCRIAEAGRIIKLTPGSYEIRDLRCPVTNPLLKQLIENSSPGLVIFTSGSTGTPKGILQNFDRLLNKYREQKPALRTMLFLMFDHIGGLNTIFHTLLNGGCLVTAETRQVDTICRLVEQYRVELLPATPSFLNLLLLSDAYRDYDLSSLKIISYGTEVMQESVLKRLNAIFSQVKFRQTYGLSEMGILNVKSRSADTVWIEMNHDEYRIKIEGNKLFIKSDYAMEGYLNAENPFDADGWYNTEDVVEQENGFLKILGRESEIINVGGEKMYPAAIEDVLLGMPGIKDVSVRAEKNPIMGNIVVAEVNLTEDENILDLKKRMRAFCEGRLSKRMIPARIEIRQENLFTNRFKKART